MSLFWAISNGKTDKVYNSAIIKSKSNMKINLLFGRNTKILQLLLLFSISSLCLFHLLRYKSMGTNYYFIEKRHKLNKNLSTNILNILYVQEYISIYLPFSALILF